MSPKCMAVNEEKTIFHSIFFSFLIKKNYLFILFGCLGSQLCHVGSLDEAPSLSSNAQAQLLCLSCSTACGTLAPRPGTEPGSPALQGEFLTTAP